MARSTMGRKFRIGDLAEIVLGLYGALPLPMEENPNRNLGRVPHTKTLVLADSPNKLTGLATLKRAIETRDNLMGGWDKVVVLGWNFDSNIGHDGRRCDSVPSNTDGCSASLRRWFAGNAGNSRSRGAFVRAGPRASPRRCATSRRAPRGGNRPSTCVALALRKTAACTIGSSVQPVGAAQGLGYAEWRPRPRTPPETP
jgi:hypothetical protein